MDSKDLKLSSKWKLKFPKSPTEEEMHLKSKYAELKQMIQKLERYETSGKCDSPMNILKVAGNSKKMASLRVEEINSKKTSDFKKPVNRRPLNVTERSVPRYSFEDDAQPRSIIIRARGLTDSFLRDNFDKFGFIWKIRTNESKTSSVLSFKRSSRAKMAADTMNGCIINGTELQVCMMKQKNSVWNTSSASKCDTKSEYQCSGKSVRLNITGYLSTKDIEDLFENVGRTTRIYLNNKKKYGFVTFENNDQAERAIREVNGEIYKGVKVTISPQVVTVDDAMKVNKPEHNNDREAISYTDVGY